MLLNKTKNIEQGIKYIELTHLIDLNNKLLNYKLAPFKKHP